MSTTINVTVGDGGLPERNRQQTAANRQAYVQGKASERAAQGGLERRAAERIAAGLDPVTGRPLVPSSLSGFRRLDQQPAANRQQAGIGWLMVPSGPWQPSLDGYRCITNGLPNRPLVTSQNDYTFSAGKLRPRARTEGGQKVLGSSASYDAKGSQAVSGRLFQPATFEGFIDTSSGGTPLASSGVYNSLGFWKWDYVYKIDRFDTQSGEFIGSTTFTGELLTTSPTGLARPDPPSEYFPWPSTEVNPSQTLVTSLISETKVIITPPSSSPIYVSGGGGVSFSLILTPAGGSDTAATFTFSTNMAVSSEPGFTSASASMDVNGDNIGVNIGFGGRKIHYAFTIVSETVTGYIDGRRLLLSQSPSINPALLYDAQIVTSAVAQDFNDTPVVDPFLVGDTASGGSVRVADAAAHSIFGIRFTPGRALYRGPSFTPPTSITKLA